MLRDRAVGADRSPPAAGRHGPHPGVRPARREGSEGEGETSPANAPDGTVRTLRLLLGRATHGPWSGSRLKAPLTT